MTDHPTNAPANALDPVAVADDAALGHPVNAADVYDLLDMSDPAQNARHQIRGTIINLTNALIEHRQHFNPDALAYDMNPLHQTMERLYRTWMREPANAAAMRAENTRLASQVPPGVADELLNLPRGGALREVPPAAAGASHTGLPPGGADPTGLSPAQGLPEGDPSLTSLAQGGSTGTSDATGHVGGQSQDDTSQR